MHTGMLVSASEIFYNENDVTDCTTEFTVDSTVTSVDRNWPDKDFCSH